MDRAWVCDQRQTETTQTGLCAVRKDRVMMMAMIVKDSVLD